MMKEMKKDSMDRFCGIWRKRLRGDGRCWAARLASRRQPSRQLPI